MSRHVLYRVFGGYDLEGHLEGLCAAYRMGFYVRHFMADQMSSILTG